MINLMQTLFPLREDYMLCPNKTICFAQIRLDTLSFYFDSLVKHFDRSSYLPINLYKSPIINTI